MSILSPVVGALVHPDRISGSNDVSSPVVPPLAFTDSARALTVMSDVDRTRSLARALLTDARPDHSDIYELEADLDEFVSVWTPTLCARSRFELVSSVVAADDAISDVVVAFAGTLVATPRVVVEWSARGRFSRPVFLHDDVLVEPTGRIIRAAGALSASFRSGRATHICCYFDRMAILRQLLHEGRPRRQDLDRQPGATC
jgi:hypothetical protein